jgi:hypothetical protein
MRELNESLIVEQYRTVRSEISQLQERRSSYLVSGSFISFIVEAAALFLKTTTANLEAPQSPTNAEIQATILLAAIPLLVFAVALGYLASSHAIMRAGAFLLSETPRSFGSTLGWEAWLEVDDDSYLPKRKSDCYVHISLCLYFAALIAAFSAIAIFQVVSAPHWARLLFVLYGLLLSSYLLLAFLQWAYCTKTSAWLSRDRKNE